MQNESEAPQPDSSSLDREIIAYWDERAHSFSCGVCDEINGEALPTWQKILQHETGLQVAEALSRYETPLALDLGCGPGLFSIILAKLGCRVKAVDSSSGMLDQACANVESYGDPENVSFHQADISCVDFPPNSFDIIALRNVTWLMREPRAAYAHWLSLLRPGGALIVFDANWYRYLSDDAINAAREKDQTDVSVLGYSEDALFTHEQELRCEAIATKLPLSSIDRPSWDVQTLKELGASSVEADTSVWTKLWSEGEKRFYGSSPLFMIKAIK